MVLRVDAEGTGFGGFDAQFPDSFVYLIDCEYREKVMGGLKVNSVHVVISKSN